MDDLKAFIVKYREQLAYLFFGGVTTAVNLVIYAGLHTLMGVGSDLSNLIAWAAAVLVAYVTNRKWVFRSRTRGAAMLREMGGFVAARVATGVMDMAIMHVAVEVLGPRLFPGPGRALWDIGCKVATNVLVIVLNYVFSKLFIFKKRGE